MLTRTAVAPQGWRGEREGGTIRFWFTGEPKISDAESIRRRLNQLEIDVQGLQLASAERHIAVLNAVEKVLHQLQARNRKRDEEKAPDDDLRDVAAMELAPYHPPPKRKLRPW